jgi:5'-nucleotidase (lipoprotein e(P4) family)
MKKILIATAVLLPLLCNVAVASNQFASICAPSTQKNATILQADKWYRDSAEKKASYRQVYNIGSAYIKQWVAQHHPKAKTWGVVLDIDETTLDNSWYFYQCSSLTPNPADFSHFVTIPQKSQALPGVVAFTQLVHQLGGYVSLISNRDGSYVDQSGITSLEATINNLKQQQVIFDQVILANNKNSKHPSDKNPRFNAVTHGCYDANEMVWSNKLPSHQVIAYFGDNIQDFPTFKQATAYALPNDTQQYAKFGHGYFILPNPLYGSWQANRYE